MSQEFQAAKKLGLYSIVETKMKNEKNWAKTVALNVHNDYLEVSQIEEYVSGALMIGDTLECRVVSNDSIIVMDTLVYNIKLLSNSIVLKILNAQEFENLRKHERYEISCSATFRKKDEMGEKYSVVNNVSLSGLSIITRDQLSKDDTIEINIKCPAGCFVSAECIVMWVTQSEQSYFCGLLISYMDEVNKVIYKNLLRKLQKEEKKVKKKLEKEAIIASGAGEEKNSHGITEEEPMTP